MCVCGMYIVVFISTIEEKPFPREKFYLELIKQIIAKYQCDVIDRRQSRQADHPMMLTKMHFSSFYKAKKVKI